MIEVGQDVGAPLGQGPGRLGDLLQPGRDGLPQGADEPLHQELPQARVLGAVGLDQALVDAPGGLDRGVALIGEQWFSRRWARASVSRSAPVSSVRRAR